jgi:hypothetical protein
MMQGADIDCDVRFGSKADIAARPRNCPQFAHP